MRIGKDGQPKCGHHARPDFPTWAETAIEDEQSGQRSKGAEIMPPAPRLAPQRLTLMDGAIVEKIRNLEAKGMGAAAIGRELNLPRGTVHRHLQRSKNGNGDRAPAPKNGNGHGAGSAEACAKTSGSTANKNGNGSLVSFLNAAWGSLTDQEKQRLLVAGTIALLKGGNLPDA